MTTTFSAVDGMELIAMDDPYPAYAELRRQGPVIRSTAATWYVPRYADVARLLRDRRLGADFPVEYHTFSLGSGPAAEFRRRIILYRDPPDHTRLRRLMGSAFTPTSVPGLRAKVEAVVDDVLDRALEHGHLDVVGELGYDVPLAIACELIGIPTGDRQEVRRRAVDLGRSFGVFVSQDDRALADSAVVWLRAYVTDLIEERRRAPQADLVSVLLQAGENEDRLAPEEIADNILFAFFAGFETTVNVIGTGAVELLAHRDQLALLRKDPSLAATAVEEFLRYESPVAGVARLVLQSVEIGERTIRRGRVLLLMLGSANRDEREFADPDRLDITRAPNPHVSFGGGIHHCMGAALARLEATVVFQRLVTRTGSFDLSAPPQREPTGRFRGYASVPVAVTTP